MDIVDLLKDGYAFNGDPLHRKALDEIERLRGIINDDRLEGAADEIERLREALQWAIKDCDAKTNHESIKRELLEALEGK